MTRRLRAIEIGVPLDVITADHNGPQFESTLTFDDAVPRFDTVVLFRQMAREVAREVAREQGIILTFEPKPHLNKGGSGIHVNVAQVDGQGDNANAKGRWGDPDTLSDVARGCIAGWMKHRKAMAGLMAPNALSHARPQPASLSGQSGMS